MSNKYQFLTFEDTFLRSDESNWKAFARLKPLRGQQNMTLSVPKSTPWGEKSILLCLITGADPGRLERRKSPNLESERGGGLKKLMAN